MTGPGIIPRKLEYEKRADGFGPTIEYFGTRSKPRGLQIAREQLVDSGLLITVSREQVLVQVVVRLIIIPSYPKPLSFHSKQLLRHSIIIGYMAQLYASPNNLRNPLHGRGPNRDRLDRFLAERRDRRHLYGNNERYEHGREDSRQILK